MGFRFRKSVKAGPFRLNFSKSGVGWSVGGPGYRYTKKANGGTRTTVSVPGTGISYVKDSKSSSMPKYSAPAGEHTPGNSPGCLKLCLMVLFWPITLIYLFVKWCKKNNEKYHDRSLLKRPWIWVTTVLIILVLLVPSGSPDSSSTPSVSPTPEISTAEGASAPDPTETPVPTPEETPEPTLAPTPENIEEIQNQSSEDVSQEAEAPAVVPVAPTGDTTASNPAPDSSASSSTQSSSSQGSGSSQQSTAPITDTAPQDAMVWIAGSGNGTKYHSSSSCSSMKNPIQVTLSDAIARGYGPCARCH